MEGSHENTNNITYIIPESCSSQEVQRMADYMRNAANKNIILYNSEGESINPKQILDTIMLTWFNHVDIWDIFQYFNYINQILIAGGNTPISEIQLGAYKQEIHTIFEKLHKYRDKLSTNEKDYDESKPFHSDLEELQRKNPVETLWLYFYFKFLETHIKIVPQDEKTTQAGLEKLLKHAQIIWLLEGD